MIENTKLFLCQASEPVPETRVQDDCTSEEILGLFQDRDAAERAFAEHWAWRCAEVVDEQLAEGEDLMDALDTATSWTCGLEMVVTELEVR